MLKPSLKNLIKPASTFLDESDGGHVHKNKLTGELYTGCTTIADSLEKSFMGPWYAKEAIAEAISKLPELSLALQENPSTKAAEEILLGCKSAAKRKAEAAAEAGTIAHEWFEGFVSQKIDKELQLKEVPENEMSKAAIEAFCMWEKNIKPEWLASELEVSSDKYKVAGTLDALANIDGVSTLMDFKTSSRISDSYSLQLAGYALMLEEMGYVPRQWLIVRTPKDGTEVETLLITDQLEMEFYKETFLRLREVHKFGVYQQNNKSK